ncbi:MAG: LuxR C-terminal-related transcriptional regulator [Actinomycetota bacterium]
MPHDSGSTPDENPRDQDRALLALLAKGLTVADLATAMERSERDLYASLNDLYNRLGVRNRTEAVAEARRLNRL